VPDQVELTDLGPLVQDQPVHEDQVQVADGGLRAQLDVIGQQEREPDTGLGVHLVAEQTVHEALHRPRQDDGDERGQESDHPT
jgi:hypothetical protein